MKRVLLLALSTVVAANVYAVDPAVPQSLNCTLLPSGILQCDYDRNHFTFEPPATNPVAGTYQFQYAETLKSDLYPVYYYKNGAEEVMLFTEPTQQAKADFQHSPYWQPATKTTAIYRCQAEASQCPFESAE